jgi:hypothetical protein
MEDPVTDPYDLIRDALPVMRRLAKKGDKDAKAWVKAYRKLPGADLTKRQVEVLRFRDLRPHDRRATEVLKKRGYLEGHRKMVGLYKSRRLETVWRRGEKGREALRLRNEMRNEL